MWQEGLGEKPGDWLIEDFAAPDELTTFPFSLEASLSTGAPYLSPSNENFLPLFEASHCPSTCTARNQGRDPGGRIPH